MTKSTASSVTETVPLSELVREVKPGFATGERTPEGVIQVRMNNVDTLGNLDLRDVIRVPASFNQIKDCSLRVGDVLFNNTNSTELVGKSSIYRGHSEPVTFSNHFTRLRVNEGKLNPYYLARWLTQQHKLGVFQGLCTRWVGQSAVRSEKLLALKIPLPSTSKQQWIVDILDKSDVIRRNQQTFHDQALSLLISTFVDMIGDPQANPRGWKQKPLGDFLTFLTSGSRGWSEHYVAEGKRFIRSLDVQMNEISSKDSCFVNPPTGRESERTRVQDGDVVLTITGSKIGRVAYVPEQFGEAYVSQHVAILRPKVDLRSRFLSMFLSHPNGGQVQIQRSQYGQTKPGLGLDHIRRFSIPIVPTKIQDNFIEFWFKHDQLMGRAKAACATTTELFDSLTQRAFSGEL